MVDTKIPEINRMQFGIIDEHFVNQATSQANLFADMSAQIEQSLKTMESPFFVPQFLARILSNEVDATVLIINALGRELEVNVAWKYKWSKVLIDDVGVIVEPPDVHHEKDEEINTDKVQELLSANEGYAYNTAEMGHVNQAPIIFGVDMSGADYPAGFSPFPVENDTYVLMQPMRADGDAGAFYLFTLMGTHDGTCIENVSP
jgi:hypothetical protein